MNVILSIHPEWAKLIYEGKKTIEWRKNIPLNNVELVYLYETSPVCKVTGFFKFFAYTRVSKTHLELEKKLLEEKGCVPIDDLKKYFGKQEKIFGWFCNANRLHNRFSKPVSLSDFGIKRPPQSWIYTKVTLNEKTIADDFRDLRRLNNILQFERRQTSGVQHGT